MEAVIDWGFASQTMPGQSVCGDGFFVQIWENQALFALMDGLGHGPEAARAVEVASKALDEHHHSGVVLDLLYVHNALHYTRGVCIAAALIDMTVGAMSWAGIGDVDGILIRPVTNERRWMPHRNGVLGMASDLVRKLRLSVEPVASGDLIMFATDGVSRRHAPMLDRTRDPQSIAEDLLVMNAKGTDDASVLAVRIR
jgi:phosphoserine phosphatase RsbX